VSVLFLGFGFLCGGWCEMAGCDWCALDKSVLLAVVVRHRRSGVVRTFSLCSRCHGEGATWRLAWVPLAPVLDVVLGPSELKEPIGSPWRRS